MLLIQIEENIIEATVKIIATCCNTNPLLAFYCLPITNDLFQAIDGYDVAYI